MDGYLLEKQVQCTIINPLRIGIGGQLPPHLISVGVNHRTLPNLALRSLSIADLSFSRATSTTCTLTIYESKLTRSTILAISANPAAIVREPFSTTLQIHRRLAAAEEMEDQDDASAEWKADKAKIEEAEEAITVFKNLLADVTRDWADEEKRVIGHITFLSSATTATNTKDHIYFQANTWYCASRSPCSRIIESADREARR